MAGNKPGMERKPVCQRKQRRINLIPTACIEHDNGKFSGIAKNVSSNGAFLEVDGKFDVNDKVNVSFCFVGDSATVTLSAPSTIVRVDNTGVGLKLPKLSVFKLMYLDYLMAQGNDKTEQITEEYKQYFDERGNRWKLACMQH